MSRLLDAVRWLEGAPNTTLVPASWARELLRDALTAQPPEEPQQIPTDRASDWRERLWHAPDEMRIGAKEVAAAVGKPISWVYRHTSAKSGYDLLPHRRIDNALTFTVGDIKAYIAAHEKIVIEPPTTVVPVNRRLRRQTG